MTTTGIKRLDMLLTRAVESKVTGGAYYLDCYNQIIRSAFSGTITARVDDDNKFVMEIYGEDSSDIPEDV